MGLRWYAILFGVVLMQGTLSHSPIPEMMTLEEEWELFNARLEDPSFRLPTTTSPEQYEVSLTPYFENPPTGKSAFSFDGTVVIKLRAANNIAANINEIVMHCDVAISQLTVSHIVGVQEVNIQAPNQNFACDERTKFLTITTTEPLVAGREYTVRSTFVGQLQTNMRGFYRSWYKDSTGLKRWMGTTQFQPGHARQAFPCYDEPGFKAYFDITIVRESTFSPTISNMPLKGLPVTLADGRIAETFHTTPKTSTYLLAFIVSHYVEVAANNDVSRPFAIYARNNIQNWGEYALEVGEKLLREMEDYTQFPYYTMAENMNMKQAAIPDFSAGAMENWGLLTYREALILFDPENTNNFYKQRIANIVSHEIAHMWFGNLVTCAWWDNLWLNEGFARYYQYFLTAKVEAEMDFPTRFIVEQLHVSMLSDSVDSAHPLTDPRVSDPTSVSAHFSTITYARGASILRMTEHLLGETTFRNALRNYLEARKYEVAEPNHLFSALDEEAARDGALSAYSGITVESYFKTWSENAGHPLLSVSINRDTGVMTVYQARWEVTSGQSAISNIYYIPLTWSTADNLNFGNTKPQLMMTAQVQVVNSVTTGLNWVILNNQQTGFYRVNYDDLNWALITRALRSEERTNIHEYNRAQIVDDLFNFARSGLFTYQKALNILSFLEFEDAYAPWIAATTGFNFAIRRLAHDDGSRNQLNELISNDLSKAIVNRLGYQDRASDTFMDGLLRMHVMTFLCNVGHQGCMNAARTSFQNWRTAGTRIPPNMRPWVYCNGLRYGTAADFDYFWDRYLVENLANEQVVMITAAGCTGDTASLNKYWEAITHLTEEIIRPQDISSAITSAITSNEENTQKSFDWLKLNLDRARDSGNLATPLRTIFGRLLNEAEITSALAWLEQNRSVLGESIYTGCIAAVETARANRRWYELRVPEFNEYFENGYQEPAIEETDVTDYPTSTTDATSTIDDGASTTVDGGSTTDDGSSTTDDGSSTTDDGSSTTDDGSSTTDDGEGTTEAEDSSANVAALSLITLIVTLCINLVA